METRRGAKPLKRGKPAVAMKRQAGNPETATQEPLKNSQAAPSNQHTAQKMPGQGGDQHG